MNFLQATRLLNQALPVSARIAARHVTPAATAATSQRKATGAKRNFSTSGRRNGKAGDVSVSVGEKLI